MYNISLTSYLFIAIFIFFHINYTPIMNAQSSKVSTIVNVQDFVSDAILDVRYATTNNFTGKAVYDSAFVLLVEDAAIALKKAADSLRVQGYRLILFDGYRPIEVQQKFWDIYPDPTYVADPKKGSRHNRGAAIDLSLADLEGNPVLMPTDFDHFGPEAHHNYKEASPEAIKHRTILKTAMIQAGFEILDSEWWHYDLKNWENYPIIR